MADIKKVENSVPSLAQRMQDTLTNKKKMNRLFVFLLGLVEVLIVVFMVYTAFEKISISQIVAMEIILLWFGILVGYLAWAVYFYNINLGLTDQDWEEIRAKKELGEVVDAPDTNPHNEQTLGLPKGTVRGAVALTMLIGGLAMVIYSFGLDTDYRESSFIVDHLQFFKTAFLMMIAFYFGNKSLEALGKSPELVSKNPSSPVGGKPKRPIPSSPVNESVSQLKESLGSNLDESKDDTPSAANEFDIPNAIG